MENDCWSRQKTVGLIVLCGVFAYSYWPTIVTLVETWNREPDYSHGFLVLPLALYFAWDRRERRPHLTSRLAWQGLAVIAGAIAMRVFAAKYYIDAIDGWSLIVWVAGVVWLFGGTRVVLWAWPSLAFLWFMVPLPFRVERMVSYPLQRIATKFSCWIFQSFGQPALAEGNTVLLGDHHLQVEEACSGLRIFVSIVALAFAYMVLIRRSWWERVLVGAATLPVALIVNAIRIVITGMPLQYVSGDAAARFSHDLAGWMMIPIAALMFGFVVWFTGKLFPEMERVDIRAVLQSERALT